MTASNLPILGAALPVDALEAHLDWLVQDQRDLEIQTFFDAEVLEGDWRGLAEKAQTILAPHSGRRGIHGPFPGLSLASPDPDIRAVVKKRLQQGLDVCAAVGATQMVLHSPYRHWDHENLENHVDGPAKLVARFEQTMEAAVARAEREGVEMVLENIEDRDPSSRLRLAERFDSPALKLSIDTGHAYYAHRMGAAPAVDRYVRAAGDRLAHMHLQDADGFADRHWPLGEGTIPWAAVFEELGRLASNPRLIIEIRPKNDIARSARFMEERGLAR